MDLFTLFGRISIDATEANGTIDSTMTQVDGLKKSLEGAESQSKSTGKTFASGGSLHSGSVFLGNMYTKIGSSVINMLKTFTKTGFAFDASMEAYQGQFAALLNDGGKAQKLVADLQLLAKVSPLGMEGLANNAVSLLNTGTKLEDIVPTLEMLGNLALGDTNKMDSIVRAYTQILAKGKVMAQEMYQLGDAGVPFREIMTLYGGEDYADGTWFESKMANPTDPRFTIAAEDMVTAFQAATAEGGKWHNYMFAMMDTWNGQVDRMGEEGKENIGAFMNPFFEVAKADVLPKLTESLGKFGTWVTENQDVLSKMADAVGGFVTGGFDMMISAFEWMVENGEAVKVALAGITLGIVAASIAAHPFATAIAAVVAGLTLLKAESKGLSTGANYDKFFDGYSNEDLQTLQQYVDAVNAARKAEQAYLNSGFGEAEGAALDAANKKKQAAFESANAIDGLIGTYHSWRSGQAVNQGQDLYLDVPLRASEDSEGTMQTEVEGYELEGEADILASAQSEALIQAALKAMNLTADVTLKPKLSGFSALLGGLLNIPGHATGLERVPKDNYIARLHKDEAVLTSSEAAIWRDEKQPRASAFNRRNTRDTTDQPITVNLTVNGNSGSPYEIAGAVRDAMEMVRWGV